MFSKSPKAFKDTASLVTTVNINWILRVEKQEFQKAWLFLIKLFANTDIALNYAFLSCSDLFITGGALNGFSGLSYFI